MKVYSDTLTYADLRAAARYARIALDTCEPIEGARVRSRGWTVRLSGSSTRHRNSGTHGAATWESAPATYDEHGHWMAWLFDIDPNARIAEYDGAHNFHAFTYDAYRRVGVLVPGTGRVV